jgi:hypothetical protein
MKLGVIAAAIRLAVTLLTPREALEGAAPPVVDCFCLRRPGKQANW